MSITQKAIASVQKAGNAVHEANKAFETAARDASMDLVSTMAAQPLSNAADRLFARCKAIARIKEELDGMENQLRDVFSRLGSLAEPATEVLEPIQRIAAYSGAATVAQPVQDVEAKPIATRRSKGKRPAKETAKQARQQGGVNEQRMMTFLATKLDKKTPVAVRQQDMSEGTGIPLGSIGGTLKKLIKKGQLVEQARGVYVLK